MHKYMRRACMALGVAALLAGGAPAQANPAWVDDIGVDRFAHYGCSYVAAETLHRAGMNRFWAGVTTLALGAAKEAWMDDRFDRGDFAADAAGVLTWEIHF